uniref:GATOR2 complex protein WDR24 n=1 Tax=Ditylenchus dipsaci TaxID=166011 RepID=A0A915CZ35_9BILA
MGYTEKCIAFKQSDPLDALCTNKERTMVAVAGRVVMKVFSIHEDRPEFELIARKVNQNSYFTSLSWSKFKGNLIASSLLNGAVLLWDIENSQRANPEQQYKAHRKSANKVCFSEFNENYLLSCSKDTTINLYDIRSSEPTTSFSNKDTPVRDVQFCIESNNQDKFVTADDNGTVKFWDIRRPDRVLNLIIAHTGQVSSVALRPSNLIATAGRDKFIRIWDWSDHNPKTPEYFVEQWQQSLGYHGVQTILGIWLVARTFNAHTETVTDMSWPRGIAAQQNKSVPGQPIIPTDRFISCGRDGRLILHFMEHGFRPMKYANSVALAYNSPCDGLIVSIPPLPRRSANPDLSDPLGERSRMLSSTPLLLFKIQTGGGSVDELCEYNAEVADDIGQEQIAYSWRMIALLCSGTDLGSVRPQFSTRNGFKRTISQGNLDQNKENETNNRSNSMSDGNEDEAAATTLISGSLSQGYQNAFATSNDFFFGEGELNLYGMSGDDSHILSASRQSINITSDLSKIKDEAFDVKNNGRNADPTRAGHHREDSLAEEDVDETEFFSDGDQMSNSSSSSTQDEIEINGGANLSIAWDPLPRIKSILDYFSQMGDVQSCAAMCLVFGDKVVDSKLIKTNQAELWFYEYLELLERLQLWNAAAAFIKVCFRSRISELSNQGTYVKVLCTNCKAHMVSSAMPCKECNKSISYRCCICESRMKGVWSGCSECGHGGHIECMRQWFTEFDFCPFLGCGHGCQRKPKR